MRSRLLLVTSASVVLAAATASLNACSASPGPAGNTGAVAEEEDDAGVDGSHDGAPGVAATWAETPLDPAYAASGVSGDARGIWVQLYSRTTADDQWTVKAEQIGADGVFAERYTKTVSAVISSNFTIAGMAPVTSTTAVIGGEWFLDIIGGSSTITLGGSASYVTAVYGRGESDVWAGTRVGTIEHYSGGSTPTRYRLAEEVTTRGMWQSKSTLYLATEDLGIRRVALPIPDAWNGATTRAIAGKFRSISGSADDNAFAAGADGLLAHYDGASWTTQASGTKSDLGSIATHAADDVWAAGDDVLLHYDGKVWSTVNEAGMPKGGSVAVAGDGTLWVTSSGKLFHRSHGAVKGTPATGTTDGGSGDGGVCGFGEPNDTHATATELPPTFSINACAPANDVDEYSFVTPTGKAGGFAAISFTDTAGGHPNLITDFDLPGHEQPSLGFSGAAGEVKHLFLPLPGARRSSIDIGQAYVIGSTGAYALEVKYMPFDDKYEPNDKWNSAASIAVGSAIQAFLPTGVPTKIGVPGQDDEYDDADWYEAYKAAGRFSVAVTNVPADSQVKITVSRVDSAGSALAIGSIDGTLGAPITFTGTLASAATLRIEIQDVAPRVWDGAAAPGAFTQKYTLLVGN